VGTIDQNYLVIPDTSWNPDVKGDNYRLWARKMTAYLQVKGLYKYMRDSFITPLDLNVTELTQMNAHDWNATNDD